jgi:hypothetical protein
VRRPVLAALLINALLFGAFFALASPRYETNDDVQMMLIASGAYTGKPSAFLLFTNVALGFLLERLYQHSDAVNWYASLLYAVHFLAMVALLVALQHRCGARRSLLFFALLFFTFELCFLLLLQFTTTAAVAAVSGSLLLLSFPPDERRPRSALVLGVSLVVLAAMIREGAFYLMLFLLLPVGLHRALTGGRARALSHLGLALSISGAAIAFDAHVYARDEGWRRHREYNEVRSVLHDRVDPAYDAHTRPVLEQIGWSENDLRMFRSWFIADPELYSLGRLQSLREGLRPQSGLGARYRGIRRLAFQVSGARTFFYLSLANAALAGALAMGRRGSLLLLALGLGAAGLASGSYLALLWRLPERVLLPMLLAVNASVFFATSADPLPARGRSVADGGVRMLMLMMIAAGLLPHAGHLNAIDRENRRELRAFEKILGRLAADFGGPERRPVFVVWGAALPIESASPLSAPSALAALQTIPLSWTTNSPLYAETLRRYGVEDLHTALYQRDDLYLIVPPSPRSTSNSGATLRREVCSPHLIDVLHEASWGAFQWRSSPGG